MKYILSPPLIVGIELLIGIIGGAFTSFSKYRSKTYLVASVVNVVYLSIICAFGFKYFANLNHYSILSTPGGIAEIFGIGMKFTNLSLPIIASSAIAFSATSLNEISRGSKNQLGLIIGVGTIHIAGIIGASFSVDIFNIYVFMEIIAVTMVALCASQDNLQSDPYIAAFDYFILSIVSSTIFLFGVALVYVGTGSLNLSTIGTMIRSLNASNAAKTNVGIAMIIIALSFKSGLFPFVKTVESAYKNAPNAIVTLILPITSKIWSLVASTILISLPSSYILLFLIHTTCSISAIKHLRRKKTENNTQMYCCSSSIMTSCMCFSISTTFPTDYGIVGCFILSDGISKIPFFLASSKDRKEITKTNATFNLALLRLSKISRIILALNIVGIPGTLGFRAKLSTIQILVQKPISYTAITSVILCIAASTMYGTEILCNSINDYIDNVQFKTGFATSTMTILAAIAVIYLGFWSEFFSILRIGGAQ